MVSYNICLCIVFVNMFYTCVSAECFSNGRKKPSKYPFMRDVTWVKWPRKDNSRSQRWLKHFLYDCT